MRSKRRRAERAELETSQRSIARFIHFTILTVMSSMAEAAVSTIAEAGQTAETAIAEAAVAAVTMPNAMSDSCHGDGFRVVPVVGNVVAGAGHGDQTEQKKHSSDLHVGSEKKKSSMGVCLLLNS